MNNFIPLVVALIMISICVFALWLKMRRKKRTLNRELWYAAILKTLEDGCWLADPEEKYKRWKVTGVNEAAGEVYLTLYRLNPKNGEQKQVTTEMWTLEYVLLGLYNNEIIIVEK